MNNRVQNSSNCSNRSNNIKDKNPMKRKLRIMTIAAMLAFSPLFMLAQAPPHPNGGNAPGTGNTKVGDNPSGAGIGDGVFVLLALSMAYAGRKLYELRNAKEEPQNS
jgi:hypothetical protein